MRRLARQRKAVVAIGLLLSVFGSCGAGATEARLIATCQEPTTADAQSSFSCDVRATGFAVVEGVTASLKGATGELKSRFKAFDSFEQSTNTAYLIQMMPYARRATLTQMGDAVVTLTDPRQGKRRFSAYTYGTDLSLISDSGTSKAEFVRQMIALKPTSTKVELYKAATEAIEILAREGGDRKALVIMGDGTADGSGFTQDQVVKAAKDAGVVIHVLGYYDDRAGRSKFQGLSRLADETGGYAIEIKQGANRDDTKNIVSSRFVSELLENGGTVTADLPGFAGPQTLVLTASLSEGPALVAEQAVNVPAQPKPSFETTLTPEPDPEPMGALDLLADNPAIAIAILAALGGLGAFGYKMYARAQQPEEVLSAPEPLDDPLADESDIEEETTEMEDGEHTGPVTADDAQADDTAPPSELLRDADGLPAVYGWLEQVDGDASRHPLRTTNVRVGRHRDNDICLRNDSISRRHAVLHFNPDTRRFVITDLGAGNGVIVNKTKYKSRELSDGDMVELGEVRLRFKAEAGYLA